MIIYGLDLIEEAQRDVAHASAELDTLRKLRQDVTHAGFELHKAEQRLSHMQAGENIPSWCASDSAHQPSGRRVG